MATVAIYIRGSVPNKSLIQNNKYWTFKREPFFNRRENKDSEKKYIYYLEINSQLDFIREEKFYVPGHNALMELIRIQEVEKNDLEFTYHYSYFYKNQCNMEFDREFVKLLGELNCYVTITCAEDDEDDQEA